MVTFLYDVDQARQAALRATIFRHLDGIVTARTAYPLIERSVLTYLLEHKTADVTELTSTLEANEGYLNVAWHILGSPGWLDAEVDNANNRVEYSVTAKSATAARGRH